MESNPPFQPLTLSVEEWKACDERARKGGNHIERLLHRECEAQAQEAASLRQRLEQVANGLRSQRDTLESVQSQLEQAQKERDEAQAALVKLTADIPKTEKRLEQTAAKANLRASRAEAALAEKRKECHDLRGQLQTLSLKLAIQAGQEQG